MEITAIVLWIVAFFIIMGSLFNIVMRAIKRKRCTEITAGTITDIKEKIKRGEEYSTREYYSTVSYIVGGVTYTKPFIKAYNSETFKVGQEVDVMYNPNKPSEINTLGVSNIAAFVVLGVGLLIGVSGIILLAIA